MLNALVPAKEPTATQTFAGAMTTAPSATSIPTHNNNHTADAHLWMMNVRTLAPLPKGSQLDLSSMPSTPAPAVLLALTALHRTAAPPAPMAPAMTPAPAMRHRRSSCRNTVHRPSHGPNSSGSQFQLDPSSIFNPLDPSRLWIRPALWVRPANPTHLDPSSIVPLDPSSISQPLSTGSVQPALSHGSVQHLWVRPALSPNFFTHPGSRALLLSLPLRLPLVRAPKKGESVRPLRLVPGWLARQSSYSSMCP
jgi:hypothetical protein